VFPYATNHRLTDAICITPAGQSFNQLGSLLKRSFRL
jgi:hypothetical protein